MTQSVNLADLNAADRAALDHAATRQDAMLDRVLGWAAVNTGSWNADGLKQLAPSIAEALRETGAEVEIVNAPPIEKINAKGETDAFHTGPVLRAVQRPDAPIQIVLTGHYDTVFPPNSFTDITDIGDGKLNGPGLADMKGGITVMIEALKTFEAHGETDQLGYTIILTPDEETGNFASDTFLRDAAKKAHVGLTFEPAMEDGALAGARKGSGIWDIIFRGRSAHAGREPEKGRSAIWAACEMALKVEALMGVRDGVVFNVGSVDGGAAVNIVPDNAVLRVGSRAPDPESAEWAEAQIMTALDEVLKRDGITAHTHGGFYRPPKPRNAAQDRLIGDVRETAKGIGLDLVFKDTGGVCEGNNVFAAGTPNIDTLGVRGGRIHSSDEFMVVSSLSERAGLSALLLNRLADGRMDGPAIKALMS
ncbi:acetylornithine deacetylase [Algimonas ampicilliniresistens]|uniref:Acetylornithine deacetylase n=1 Tax=Algimonas ampicilliniresistens TaxID=1298735 RepID=A0ABQ5VCS0_9PROT|nr:hydrolase [Algimonas ampicilliniresistens]GLQ24485.1 acetylornithine deacetylase [Algimonas ampicilliniresistens]